MTWHYQMRRNNDKGEVYYDVVERFTDPDGWTSNSVYIMGDSPDDLMQNLERIKQDCLRYGILDEENYGA